MRKRDVIAALSIELAVVAIYGIALWAVTHSEQLTLLKPRALRFVATTTSKAAYCLGQISIMAETASHKAMEAAKL
jgi:hypothetical protein